MHILLVEDEPFLRASLARVLGAEGYQVSAFASGEDFLDAIEQDALLAQADCLVIDVNLGGQSGLQVQQALRQQQVLFPVVFISAELDAKKVNQAWEGGGARFLFKPFSAEQLMSAIQAALTPAVRLAPAQSLPVPAQVRQQFSRLTARQIVVFNRVVAGESNPQIAQALGISSRTVKMHRAALMARLEARHLSDLVRLHEIYKSSR